MTQYDRIWRTWLSLTLLFTLSLCSLSVFFVFYRMWYIHDESKSLIQQILLTHLEKESGRISEEFYLKIGSLEEREKILNDLAGRYGVVDLTFRDGGKARSEIPAKWSHNGDSSILEMPLMFGDVYLTDLLLRITWTSFVKMPGMAKALLLASFVLVCAILLWVFIFFAVRKKVLLPLLISFQKQSNEIAIAKISSMLAHDVRKPFSMMKMFLDLISKTKKSSEVKILTGSFIPDIERTLKSVDNLIMDVVEFGRSTTLQSSPVFIEGVIAATINDVFRFIPNCDVNFEFRLDHKKQVWGDETKLSRVFMNIIQNAAEAMPNSGLIWFRTRDVLVNGRGLVEVCIGNSGPSLSKEVKARLFESFFTDGKKQGTGLGLAIAKKVVLEHGGDIWVGDSEATEFYFTVPSCQVDLEISVPVYLPESSREVYQDTAAILGFAKKARSAAKKVIKIHIVDDEPIYMHSLALLIERCRSKSLGYEITTSESVEKAIEVAESQDVDLWITDLDFGPMVPNGIALVRRLRDMGQKGYICVHSNSNLLKDHELALSAGADTFLAKPMSSEKIRTLFESVLSRLSLNIGRNDRPLNLVVVDDDPFVLEAWKLSAGRSNEVRTFLYPEDFWKAVRNRSISASDIHVIVTDFFFDSQSKKTGESFAKEVRSRFKCPIFVSSDNLFIDDVHKVFDGYLKKDPLNAMDAIQNYLTDKSALGLVQSNSATDCFT